ncbi:MAG: VOC family protein [FCB group bacterium]|jgi:PhnB protein
MKSFNVYLTFPGNCEEAINFYKSCFGGEILSKQTFGDTQMQYPVADEYKSKIMHIDYKSDVMHLMASDGMPDQPPIVGNNLSLSIDATDEKEQETFFNKLSAGGVVTMPLQDTFWNAKFGMVKDRFGINWMLNYYKPKE